MAQTMYKLTTNPDSVTETDKRALLRIFSELDDGRDIAAEDIMGPIIFGKK